MERTEFQIENDKKTTNIYVNINNTMLLTV